MVVLKSEISNLKSDFSNLKSEISNLKSPSPRRRRPRAGFTFMEILFAVIIMGVGMIMVAAMFPAAIKQTQANVEDAASTTVGRDALRQMIQIARQKDLSNAAQPKSLLGEFMQPVKTRLNPSSSSYPYVFSFHRNDVRNGSGGYMSKGPTPAEQQMLWDLIKGSVIVPSDPRYAWVPFYSRDVAVPPLTTPVPGNPRG